ncbi:amino acid-binding protein [uncultured Mycobacterium sp.]|uniref:amino acid-binding protein n=1 Tax=uncultured Mycobacterium sp. TaxID=171292 RepID=UPI0035CA7432
MATDLTLYLADEPGELARVGDVLGKAGVNIAGLCALSSGGGQSEVHILVHDATPAFEALHDAGIKIVEEQEVIVLDIQDRPGALAEAIHKLGTAKVNLETAYLATHTRLVLGADNLADAKAALG